MRNARMLAIVGALLWAGTASAEVHLTLTDGQVSVSAKGATVAQILAEWARVGQTRIVNGERVPSAPMTIEITNVPEAQALDIILRSTSGYLLAPRSQAIAGASRFDRILILLANSAPGTAAAPSLQAASPSLQQPRFEPQPPPPTDVDSDNNDPGAGGPPRPPTFTTFPQPVAAPQADDPPDQNAPQSQPDSPVGVSRPGMVAPASQPNKQPGASPGSPQR